MFLDKPLSLPCGVQLKNRIAKAAMTEGLGDPHNRATSRHVTLYKQWAEGAAGMLLTGNVMVDRRYLERPGNVVIDGAQSDEQLKRLSDWAKSVDGTGAQLWMQLSHAGRQSPKIVAAEPVGPSAVEVNLPGGQFGKPRALSAAEIEDVIERFTHAAAIAKKTGFSGVQIHAAHGYLISEFLNPLVNQRDDEWGGSLENRARLLLRIVESVRARVGSGFPISVKLNSSDFQKGGFSFADCQQVVKWLDEANIDLLEISGGSYEQPAMAGLEGTEPVHEDSGLSESTRQREAYFIQYAEKIAEISQTPLMVTGGFRSKSAMDAALENGAAQIIGLGRPLCVDTDAPQRLLNGDVEKVDVMGTSTCSWARYSRDRARALP